MKKVFFLMLMLFMPFMINAKELELEWQKNFGGSNSDNFYDIEKNNQDEFIISGLTSSKDILGIELNGNSDGLIMKLDKNMNTLWISNWGGTNNDQFYHLEILNENEYLVCGRYYSTDISGIENKGSSDAIIIKYDDNGQILWQKSLGGSGFDEIYEIKAMEDGSFIAILSTDSNDIEGITALGNTDIVIIKFNKDGNVLWQKSWGGNGRDKINDIDFDLDGNIILAGDTTSTNIAGILNKGDQDAILLKYDQNGNLMWQKSWGGNGKEYIWSFDMHENNIIAAINTYSTDLEDYENKGIRDSFLIEFDSNGEIVNKRGFGWNGDDNFNSITVTDDGRYIVSGTYLSSDIPDLEYFGSYEILIFEFDTQFNLLSQKSWGGSSADLSVMNNYIDNEIYIVGQSNSQDIEGMVNNGNFDALLLKYYYKYNIQLINSNINGIVKAVQQSSKGIITPTPDKGYEVDKIIIKDKEGNVLDVKVDKLEDGTYSFELYDDVSVEVTFKEILYNPKTGEVNYKLCICVILMLSIFGLSYLYLYRKNSIL